MSDRIFFWLAFISYAGASLLTLRRLRAAGNVSGNNEGREAVLHRLNVALMAAGVALHTVGLAVRGQTLHRCPVTNLFEVQLFLAWALVLFYLLIGPAYRVSFLGAFTAPLVSIIVVVGLLAPIDWTLPVPQKHSAWVEFHAAIGIVAGGALALSAVMGAMYLLQERQLKSRRPDATLWLLPPVDQLDVIGFRLIMLGFVLWTTGMIGGAISHKIVGAWAPAKTAWATSVWLMYGVLLATRATGVWRGHKAACVSIATFVFTLVAYWGASWLSL